MRTCVSTVRARAAQHARARPALGQLCRGGGAGAARGRLHRHRAEPVGLPRQREQPARAHPACGAPTQRHRALPSQPLSLQVQVAPALLLHSTGLCYAYGSSYIASCCCLPPACLPPLSAPPAVLDNSGLTPAALRCSEDGGLSDFLDHEQLALWPLADGTPDDIRASGCVYGTLNYGWDLRKKLKPRLPMEDLIADALERVRAPPT